MDNRLNSREEADADTKHISEITLLAFGNHPHSNQTEYFMSLSFNGVYTSGIVEYQSAFSEKGR